MKRRVDSAEGSGERNIIWRERCDRKPKDGPIAMCYPRDPPQLRWRHIGMAMGRVIF